MSNIMIEEKTIDAQLQIRLKSEGPDTVIEMAGKLNSSIPADIREKAQRLVKPGHRLILDLSGVIGISGVGMRMLLMSGGSRVVAFHRAGSELSGKSLDMVYVAMNMYWETMEFELPAPVNGLRWHLAVNTSMKPPQDIWEQEREPELNDQERQWLEEDR